MIFLLGWFTNDFYKSAPETWLHPFSSDNIYNVGTILFQWTIAIAVLMFLNKWIVRKITDHSNKLKAVEIKDQGLIRIGMAKRKMIWVKKMLLVGFNIGYAVCDD